MEGSHYAYLTFKGGVSTQITWNSSAWNISLLYLLIIQAFIYQYGLMDIYFICCNRIQYFFFFAQVVLDLVIWSHFSWLLYPFDILPLLALF